MSGSSLTIRVSRGVGTGPTRLAAFDQALRSAGVADFNLVRISSVIPPGSTVLETAGRDQVEGGHGDLLYCVYADAYSSIPGEAAWAGLTWAQHEDGSGAGLFAEHSGWSEGDVQRELHHTLDAMMADRPPGYRHQGTLLSSIMCDSRPVCAVVVASCRAVTWTEMS
jgi:arginine decarboxylase